MIEVSEESQAGISPEDQARAGLYGLIANIFHAPPSGDILKAIAGASLIDGHAESPLPGAWRQLQETSTTASEARLREEYDELFIGVSKPEIVLYASYYLSGFLMEKPLAKLREHLGELGFKRRLSVGEPEDHLSALCEVMRGLIGGAGSSPPASVETQKEFFDRYLWSWTPRLTDTLVRNTRSKFYAHAGRFAQVFFQIEKESLEIT